MESNHLANPKRPNVQTTKQTVTTTTPPTGSSAEGTSSMFANAQNISTKDTTFNITTNITNLVTVDGSPPLDTLQKPIAPHAILNAGGPADERISYSTGTRELIINCIEEWANAEGSDTTPMFWLHGPAGSGKSSIAQSIAERCETKGVPQAHFFFSRTDSSRNSLSPLVPTLVHQITQSYPEIGHSVATTLSANPLLLDSIFEDQLKQLIIEPLQAIQQSSPSYHPPLLLIDGLDECESESKGSQQRILRAFDKALAEHPYLFRLLVASRDESHIRAAFNDMSSQPLLLHLDPPERDIRTFVNDEFKRVRKTHPLAHTLDATWPSVKDVENIVQNASGRFIHAALVMRSINDSSASPVLSLARVQQGAAPLSTHSPLSNPPDSTPPTQSESPDTWSQSCADGQWKLAHPNEDNPATSALANTQDGGVAQEMENVDFGATSHYVANIHKYDSLTLRGGPAFPIAVLGLPVASFATLSQYYPHSDYPLAPPVIGSPLTVHVAVQFPSHCHEMKIIIEPFTLLFFIMIWIHRWAF